MVGYLEPRMAMLDVEGLAWEGKDCKEMEAVWRGTAGSAQAK